eukprot:gene5665-5727_t
MVLAAGAALVLLGLAWLLLARLLPVLRRPASKREYRDVLSEGVGPAQRNTALIDAPPAAAIAVPVAVETPAAATAAVADGGDDLTRIKGLGPKLSRLLADLGVTRFDQIAAWTDADIAQIDAQLGAFAGRPTRAVAGFGRCGGL